MKYDLVWNSEKLSSLSEITIIKKGTSITQNKVTPGDIPVIAGGKEPAYYHDVSNRDGNIITVSASGANSGYINYFVNPIFASDCNTIKSKDEKHISTKLIFYYLKSIQKIIYSLQRGQAQPHVYADDLMKVKIPLPPKDVQQKIVSEIEVLEKQEEDAKKKIENYKTKIFKSIKNASNFEEAKIEDIAIFLKRGKSAKYGDSNIQIIKSGQARGFKKFDFTEKHFVDKKFILDERQLKKGDLLIKSTGVGTAGRVTLFNLDGKFVADSHITILRVDNAIALSEYILYSLANIGFKNIEKLAVGQSGQVELSYKIINNIKIPLPPLSEQKKIVSEILELEQQIEELEQDIEKMPKLKEEILRKYIEE